MRIKEKRIYIYVTRFQKPEEIWDEKKFQNKNIEKEEIDIRNSAGNLSQLFFLKLIFFFLI